MKKVYQKHIDYDRRYSSKEIIGLRYYSKKMMKKRYPNKGYLVIGAMGEGVVKKLDTIVIEEAEYPYYSLRFSKYRYGVDGYIDCGNDEVIAVIKNRIKRNVLIALSITAILLLLLYGGYQLIAKDTIAIDDNLSDYSPQIELSNNVNANSIAIPGYDEITMQANSDEMYVALWNPKDNPCYFKFVITLEKEDEVLYESKLVPPGKAITSVKLNRKIKEGRYPILIRMETYSLEDGSTPLNSGTSKTVIQAVME